MAANPISRLIASKRNLRDALNRLKDSNRLCDCGVISFLGKDHQPELLPKWVNGKLRTLPIERTMLFHTLAWPRVNKCDSAHKNNRLEPPKGTRLSLSMFECFSWLVECLYLQQNIRRYWGVFGEIIFLRIGSGLRSESDFIGIRPPIH